MNDLFCEQPTVAELLERIEALEAIVYQQQRAERVKVDEPLNEAWQVWNRHRSGKGWTAKARELSMKTLRQLAGTDGHLALQIVHQSVERGWTGLFPLKDPKGSVGNTSGASSPAIPFRYKSAAETLIPTETRDDNNAAWIAQQRQYGFID